MNEKELDFNQSEINTPSDPGPAVLGRTPLVGSVRRSQGLPVIRDEVGEEFGEKGKSLLDF